MHEDIKLEYLEQAVIIRFKKHSIVMTTLEAHELAVELMKTAQVADMDKIERLIYERYAKKITARRRSSKGSR